MSNSPSPSVPVSQSEAATPSASAASPEDAAELSVQDLVTSDDEIAWDDRTLAVAAHFGYDGDSVPKQWLCATAQDAEPDGAADVRRFAQALDDLEDVTALEGGSTPQGAFRAQMLSRFGEARQLAFTVALAEDGADLLAKIAAGPGKAPGTQDDGEPEGTEIAFAPWARTMMRRGRTFLRLAEASTAQAKAACRLDPAAWPSDVWTFPGTHIVAPTPDPDTTAHAAVGAVTQALSSAMDKLADSAGALAKHAAPPAPAPEPHVKPVAALLQAPGLRQLGIAGFAPAEVGQLRLEAYQRQHRSAQCVQWLHQAANLTAVADIAAARDPYNIRSQYLLA